MEGKISDGARSLSRRVFLKVLGWLTVAGAVTKWPEAAAAQHEDIVAGNVRFEGRGGRSAGTWPGRPETAPTRGSS
jgi:hypothetical protein